MTLKVSHSPDSYSIKIIEQQILLNISTNISCNTTPYLGKRPREILSQRQNSDIKKEKQRETSYFLVALKNLMKAIERKARKLRKRANVILFLQTYNVFLCENKGLICVDALAFLEKS